MSKDKIVETDAGKVKGYKKFGLIHFKGIEYAESPIGNLRFEAPVAKKPWDGMYNAKDYGPLSPQSRTPPGIVQDENNCLSLNIFTPGLNNKKRPVIVAIHGGAYVAGGGRYEKVAKLANKGDLVGVSLNYRLGALGFCYGPGISPNCGLQDQVLALQWVSKNIEKFGGDPNNVMIFGISAGGTSVISLLAVPKARGLFHKVIAQSPVWNPIGHTKSMGLSLTENLMVELGIKKGDLNSLKKVPWQDIIRVQIKAMNIKENENISFITSYYPPFIDGEILPETPFEAIEKGKVKDIDIIAGCCRDEFRVTYAIESPDNPISISRSDLNSYLNLVASKYNFDSIRMEKFIETYRKLIVSPPCPLNEIDKQILYRFGGDMQFRLPSTRVVEAQSKFQKNIYNYLFKWELKRRQPNGEEIGAAHGLDGNFINRTFYKKDKGIGIVKSEEVLDLSNRMMNTWVAFAKTGNPNNESIPNWPRFESEKRSVIIFDKQIVVEGDPLREERMLWDGIP